MKITKVKAENFQSYKSIEFDYSNSGITLFSGTTGAGKSTVLDICSWTLFGETSKEGNVDDVRSWFSLEDCTKSLIDLEINEDHISIVRIRGNSKQNDLYIQRQDQIIRGKDLKDTQRLIEQTIGIDFELFSLSSYLHQFSKADQFFTTKAKDRREIFEKIADLSIPIKLSEKSSEKRKIVKQVLQELEKELKILNSNFSIYSDQRKKVSTSFDSWEKEHSNKIKTLKAKSNNFEDDRKNEVLDLVTKVEVISKKVVDREQLEKNKVSIKAQIKALQQIKEDQKSQLKKTSIIEADLNSLLKRHKSFLELDEQCPTCLNKSHNTYLQNEVITLEKEIGFLESVLQSEKKLLASLDYALESESKILKSYDKLREDEILNSKMISDQENYRNRLEVLRSIKNTYNESLKELEKEVNPFLQQLVESDTNIDICQQEIQTVEIKIKSNENTFSRLNWIYEKTFNLRGALLDQVRQEIQNKTNELLSSYFDGLLSVKLSFEDSDKLEVEIQNNGYVSPYKQLSGGERCILRLCFYLAVSEKIQDNKEFTLNFIMLDESLNGLNPELKTKAFKLLESLVSKYESVFVIDHHEEFQELFTNKYQVINKDGVSSIYAY